ncbi:MAG TPA: ribosome-associated translation inhibitor RaiA [Candidatus Limnocylindria bacterium]|nr:ribosome-associated translation inhibitor RaiA [Candidatus Limnocylindria bacterium]
MKLILSSHNVTLTQAIEEHILAKLDKLEHLDHRAIATRVTLENDSTKLTDKRFKCSVRLDVAGPDLYAEDWEVDLYAAIDLVMKKIEQQIRKRHNKFKARNHSEAAQGKRRRQEANI